MPCRSRAAHAIAGAARAPRFYRRFVSLWAGCYKSSVVQAENYLLACQCYIELNLVLAGMVVNPGQYRWSSYQTNGLGQADVCLTSRELYLSFGKLCFGACRWAAGFCEVM